MSMVQNCLEKKKITYCKWSLKSLKFLNIVKRSCFNTKLFVSFQKPER